MECRCYNRSRGSTTNISFGTNCKEEEWRFDDLSNKDVIAEVKQKVLALCARYPVYQQAAS